MNIANNRRGILVALIVLSMTFLAVGCSTNNSSNNEDINTNEVKDADKNTILSEIVGEIPEDAVAVIINQPTSEHLNKVSELGEFKGDESQETIMILPVYNNSTIEITTLEFKGANLVEKDIVFEKKETEDGYGLFIRATRPEGVPSYKVKVSNVETEGEYLISYNGKDGHSDIEYIKTK